MIVVDTNLIGYLFLQSEHTEQAERVLRKDAEWAAPLLWRSELRNVLALYLRKRLLTFTDALQIIKEAEWLMQGREYTATSESVMRLVTQSPCSAYDCEFVAVAMDLGVPLITFDRQILRAFPEIAISPEEFAP
jgi:predicted nucleic acid-binding protein